MIRVAMSHCKDTKNPCFILQVRPLCLPQHTPRAIFYLSYQNHQAMVIDMRISKERIETKKKQTETRKKRTSFHI